MSKHFKDEIRPAEELQGKFQRPDDKSETLIQYMYKGKMLGYYVPQRVAKAFGAAQIFDGALSQVLSAVTAPLKRAFVTYNPGWAMMNVMRDMKAWSRQLPEGSLPKYFKYAIKAAPHVFQDVFMGRPTETGRRFYKEKKLIYGYGYGEHLRNTFDDLDRLAAHVTQDERIFRTKLAEPLARFFDYMSRPGQFGEKMSKYAAAMYLEDKFPTMPDKWRAHLVRNRGGSVDFLAGGIDRGTINNFFLFSNVAAQGIKTARESWSDDPKHYWVRTITQDILPKLFMLGASAGLVGPELKRMYDAVGEYDKRNYIVFPLGWTDDGKVVYIKYPHPFQGHVMGAMTWILGRIAQKEVTAEPLPTGGWASIPDYMSGQIPYSGISPIIQSMIDTMQYASGKNPYSSFYGDVAIPEALFEAGGKYRNVAFAKHIARMGGWESLIQRSAGRYDRPSSTIEKATFLPLLGPVLSRFVKVGNRGNVEMLKEISRQTRQERIRENLEVQDILVDYIESLPDGQKISEERLKALWINAAKDGVITMGDDGKPRKSYGDFRDLAIKMSIFSYSNPYLNAMLRATSNEEKVRLTEQMLEWRNPKVSKLMTREERKLTEREKWEQRGITTYVEPGDERPVLRP